MDLVNELTSGRLNSIEKTNNTPKNDASLTLLNPINNIEDQAKIALQMHQVYGQKMTQVSAIV